MNDGPVAGAVDQVNSGGNSGGVMNTLARFAPTGLGILGGIGGTLIDPFGGGIAGAALGSGIGKAIENKSQGKGFGLASDLGAAAEGGIGQAAGFGLGKALGGGAGILSRYAGKTAENAGHVDEFGVLNPAMRENLNLDNSLNLAKRAGIPRTASAFASHPDIATGNNGILNGTLDMLVNKTAAETGKGVDLNGYRDAVVQAIKDRPELGDLAPTTGGKGGLPTSQGLGARLLSKLDSTVQNFGFGGEGTLTENTNPDQALQLLREVHRLGGSFANSVSSEGQAQKYVYDNLESFLKDRLYNNPAVKEAISNYVTTPEDEAAILKAAGGNQQYAGFLTDTLNNAKKSSDITDIERQLIDMREAGKAAVSKNANILPGEKVDAAGNIMGAAHSLATGSKVGAMASVLRNGGPKVTSKVADRTAGLLDRIATVTGPAGTALATLPNSAETGGAPTTGGNMQPSLQQPGAAGNTGNSSPELQAYNTMLTMLTMDPYLSSSLTPAIAGMAPTATKMQAAGNLLPGLESSFQNAGGAQGPILGRLQELAGLFGGPASAYKQQQSQASSLLNSLGLPQLATPGLSQTPGAANSTLSVLQALLGSVGGGGGTLGAIPAPQ